MTATGTMQTARIHGGMTATGMVRAVMKSQISVEMKTKTTSMDTSKATLTATPMV